MEGLKSSCNRKIIFYFQFMIVFALANIYLFVNLKIYSTKECQIGLNDSDNNCGYKAGYPGIEAEDKPRVDFLTSSYLISFIINEAFMASVLLIRFMNYYCCCNEQYDNCDNYCLSYYMILYCFIEFIFGIIDAAVIITLKQNNKRVEIDPGTVAAFLIRSILCLLAIIYFFIYFKEIIKCCCCFRGLTSEQSYQIQQIQIEQAENQLRENDVEIILQNNFPGISESDKTQPEDKKVPKIMEVQFD